MIPYACSDGAFEYLVQNCKNHFMDCGVMIAAMCVERSSEGGSGCFRLMNYISSDVSRTKLAKRNGRLLSIGIIK